MKQLRAPALALLSSVLLLSAGCWNSSKSVTRSINTQQFPTAGAAPSELRDGGEYILTLQPPTPAKQLASTTFGVRLARRSTGSPVHGAFVTILLNMPSMVMPGLVVPCREMRPGYYAGEGTFTMTGDWKLTAIARIAKEREQSAAIIHVR